MSFITFWILPQNILCFKSWQFLHQIIFVELISVRYIAMDWVGHGIGLDSSCPSLASNVHKKPIKSKVKSLFSTLFGNPLWYHKFIKNRSFFRTSLFCFRSWIIRVNFLGKKQKSKNRDNFGVLIICSVMFLQEGIFPFCFL